MEVRVEQLVQRGQGLGRMENGKVIFVSGALPGERVAVEVTSERKDYLTARAVDIIEPSADRVAPCCPLYGVCGGCNLMHMSHAAQVRAKETIFLAALRKAGLGDCGFQGTCIGAKLGYRTRVRFEIRDGEAGFLGSASSDFIPVRVCPVLDVRLNALLASPSVLEASPSACICDEGPLLGDATGHVTISGRRLPVRNDAFFQSNLGLLPQMIAQVVENVVGNRVMDLYSGIGTFSAFLEDTHEVLAVERNPRCLELAGSHLRKTSFFTGSVEDFSFRQRSDTIVVDPPRVGLDRKVPHQLARLGARRIIYVSCDSATFARDAAALRAEGYDLVSSRIFDFYPQTSHMESVNVLDRRT